VGDVVGQCIGARMTALLVGERPGLSSPDSLGIYLTWDPRPGRSNAERNCISNIRPPQGLAYATAAQTLHYLMSEARRREISGVALKDEQVLPPSSAEILPSPP
jgi:ethanolamine ammonia-lyase small subunit